MKHRIVVGGIEIATDLDMTLTDLRQLVRLAARLNEHECEPEDSRPAVALGFTGERAEPYADPRDDWAWIDDCKRDT